MGILTSGGGPWTRHLKSSGESEVRKKARMQHQEQLERFRFQHPRQKFLACAGNPMAACLSDVALAPTQKMNKHGEKPVMQVIVSLKIEVGASGYLSKIEG